MRPLLTSVLLAASLLRWREPTTRNRQFPPGQGPVATTAVRRHGRLAVRGNTIVDQHGRPVVLRGMSLFWSQWGGTYYDADCVKWLRDDFRCTVVLAAIGVHSGGYLRDPGLELRKAETVIQAAINAGIYVIVDWHAHDVETAAAKVFFSRIAAKYGAHPNLIYETFNEPIRQDWGTVLKPYHEAVVATIREHDPDNLIVCGTPMWSQRVDQAAADPVRGTNVAYTLHFYASTHKQDLRDRAGRRSRGMRASWSPSGAPARPPATAASTPRRPGAGSPSWRRISLSWCNWSVIDKRETSAALRPGRPPPAVGRPISSRLPADWSAPSSARGTLRRGHGTARVEWLRTSGRPDMPLAFRRPTGRPACDERYSPATPSGALDGVG